MSQADRSNLPQEPTTARRAVQTGGRLLLAAGVLFVGYWTVPRFTGLLHDREPAAVPNPSQAAGTTATEPTRLDSLGSQLGGSWEFLGAGWSLTVGTFKNYSESIKNTPRFDENTVIPTDVDPVEGALNSLLGANGEGIVDDKWETQFVEINGLVIQALRKFHRDSFRLVEANGGLRLGDDQWLTIAAVRTNQQASAQPRAGLMPTIAGVERLAVRRGTGQAIVGEFSKAALKMEPLLKLWQAAGAPVTLNDGYGVVDTREGVCNFNGRSLSVILWQPEGRSETTILVLDPSAAEAVPK